MDGGTDVVDIEAELSLGTLVGEESLLVLDESMDGSAFEAELPVGEFGGKGILAGVGRPGV